MQVPGTLCLSLTTWESWSLCASLAPAPLCICCAEMGLVQADTRGSLSLVSRPIIRPLSPPTAALQAPLDPKVCS